MTNNISEYNQWRKLNNKFIETPNFPKKNKSISISKEALTGLTELASDFVQHTENGKPVISRLIEAIGLFQLVVLPPSDSTQQYSEDGFNDAIEGRLADFYSIYPNIDKYFYYAYMRGYMEGKFFKKGEE